MTVKLNRDDVRALFTTWEGMRDDPDMDGPQVEMTSAGYVDLWADGSVTAYGVQVLDLSDYDAETIEMGVTA